MTTTLLPVTIGSDPDALRIQFERPAAAWTLLVVDDRWDHVSNMVEGHPDPDGVLTDRGGLGGACVDPDKVQAYWRARTKDPEPSMNSLYLLPWVVSDWKEVGEIVFAPFLDHLGVDWVRSLVGGTRRRIAALIDVIQGKDEVAFERSWRVLDETGVSPSFARATFTRGGIAKSLPPWYLDVPGVYKGPAEKKDHYQAICTRWWNGVLGDVRVGEEIFRKETGGSPSHDPSTLPLVEKAKLEVLLSTFVEHDPFGVWRWCREAVQEGSIDLKSQQRWLAAKALQTSPARVPSLPVVGLIGLLGGLNMYRHLRQQPGYELVSEMEAIPLENIDRFPALGVAELGGPAGRFHSAVRDWFLHPEQFEPGHARPTRVSVERPGTDRVAVVIAYSGPLPEAARGAGDRRGATAGIFLELVGFARYHRWNPADNTLTLEFGRNDG